MKLKLAVCLSLNRMVKKADKIQFKGQNIIRHLLISDGVWLNVDFGI